MTLPLFNPSSSHLEKKLESQIRKALYEFLLIPTDNPIAIALSGGKDSLTLLHFLTKISGRGFPHFPLIALHVDGAFSCGAGIDANYLQTICKDLQIPLHIRSATQEREKLSCYPCARERRNLLFDMAKNAGATTIAFGHHQDDHAQTLLMNLLHKAEFAGLLPKIPMHHYGIEIIRPLILCKEEEILAFAKQKGFARIVCRCPIGQTSLRKKTKDWLNELEEIFPHAKQNLAQAGFNYGSTKAALPPKKTVWSPPKPPHETLKHSPE